MWLKMNGFQVQKSWGQQKKPSKLPLGNNIWGASSSLRRFSAYVIIIKALYSVFKYFYKKTWLEKFKLDKIQLVTLCAKLSVTAFKWLSLEFKTIVACIYIVNSRIFHLCIFIQFSATRLFTMFRLPLHHYIHQEFNHPKMSSGR